MKGLKMIFLQLPERNRAAKKEIESLNTQYANQMEQLAKLNEERASLEKTQIEQLTLAKAQSSSAINWALVIAAIILRLLIIRSCN